MVELSSVNSLQKAGNVVMERQQYQHIFEQNSLTESEQKFTPLDADYFAPWRDVARPIEQIYLSSLDEPFGLRLRETFDAHGNASYTATLKDRGKVHNHTLTRLEIETPISAATYNFYQSNTDYPRLRKLRAEPVEGVAIDFHEQGDVILEVEQPYPAGEAFLQRHHHALTNVTGWALADNEQRAHRTVRQSHHSIDTINSDTDLDQLSAQLLAHIDQQLPTVLAIAGRSGSGKSTLVQQLQSRLRHQRPTHDIVTLSTDNYHRGRAWLEHYNAGYPWKNWDAEIVYDINALARDLAMLRRGQPIPGRRFDFATEEPVETHPISPAAVILIEGIYAGHPILRSAADLHHNVTTPLATCVGRRLLRDFSTARTNESLGTPADVLRYLLETAEPTYRAQQQL